LDIRLDDCGHDRAVGGEGHRYALEELQANGRIRRRRGDQVRPEQPEPDLIGFHDLVQGHTVRRTQPGGADWQLHLLRRRHPSFDDAPRVEARGEMTNRPVQRLECRAGEGPIAGDLSAARDDVAYHALAATVRAAHQLAQCQGRGGRPLVLRTTDLPRGLGEATHVRTAILVALWRPRSRRACQVRERAWITEASVPLP